VIFRPSRDRDRPAHAVDLRLWLFAAGAAVALTGLYTGRSWVVYLAIAILAAGFLLRFRPRR
jgi:fatty acid desaturase